MTETPDLRWVDSMPAAYDRYLVPTLFAPYAADLCRRAAAEAPRQVLELAAGTGAVTRALLDALPGAELTATDLNAAMVSLGSEQAAGATWREADAMALPFDDDAFDLVVCQFGVMFFPDRSAAYAEVRRVLRPGGTFLFSTWGTVEENDFTAAFSVGLVRAFPDDPPTFLLSIPHGYTDPEAVIADLASGGLRCRTAETVELQGAALSAEDVARGFCTGTPLRGAIEAHGDLEATVELVAAEMTARLGEGPITGSMTAHVFAAVPD